IFTRCEANYCRASKRGSPGFIKGFDHITQQLQLRVQAKGAEAACLEFAGADLSHFAGIFNF
ncbi:hypothetical protein, partial [Synechococcus sp.]